MTVKVTKREYPVKQFEKSITVKTDKNTPPPLNIQKTVPSRTITITRKSNGENNNQR